MRLKKVRSLARLLILLVISLNIITCNKDLSTSSDFLIMVDSINVPAMVNSETPFDIEFFGTISYSGCVSFKTFNKIINKDQIVIEAWATYDNKNKTCPDALVSLNGMKLNLAIPLAGIYYILIKEPNGYVITRQITVN